jgi:hypothetical protein
VERDQHKNYEGTRSRLTRGYSIVADRCADDGGPRGRLYSDTKSEAVAIRKVMVDSRSHIIAPDIYILEKQGLD